MNYSLAKDGFEIVEGILDAPSIESLRRAVDELPQRHRVGARNLLSDSEAVAELAAASSVKRLADAALGKGSLPVRALLFDKVPDANWKVPWHQDTAIAVARRVDVDGFFGWSMKDGVPHVHPPSSVLEHMVTLRVHLDDCGPENGPLRVLPGSHVQGTLSDGQIQDWRQAASEFSCCCVAGDVLVMKPLLLHASSLAVSPSHRRVIHLEYASVRLPVGLRWFVERGEDAQVD